MPPQTEGAGGTGAPVSTRHEEEGEGLLDPAAENTLRAAGTSFWRQISACKRKCFPITGVLLLLTPSHRRELLTKK